MAQRRRLLDPIESPKSRPAANLLPILPGGLSPRWFDLGEFAHRRSDLPDDWHDEVPTVWDVLLMQHHRDLWLLTVLNFTHGISRAVTGSTYVTAQEAWQAACSAIGGSAR